MGYAAAELVWLSNFGSWVAFDARLIKLIWVDGRVSLFCSGDYPLLKIAHGSFDESWVGRVLVFLRGRRRSGFIEQNFCGLIAC